MSGDEEFLSKEKEDVDVERDRHCLCIHARNDNSPPTSRLVPLLLIQPYLLRSLALLKLSLAVGDCVVQCRCTVRVFLAVML